MPPPPSGSAATPLATSLIVAEFDIDTGACLRACYPRSSTAVTSPSTSPTTASPYAVETSVPLGIANHTEYFANVMLPDGAEKVNVTRTVFVVNRPQPPAFVRFPVYRFVRETANRFSNAAADTGGAAGGAATQGTSAAASAVAPSLRSPTGDSGTSVRWRRAAGEETALYASELLLLDTSTEALSLKYKDRQIFAPTVVPMENISSVSAIPPDVVRFSKQLDAMLMNEATLAGSQTASFAGAGGDAASTGNIMDTVGVNMGSSSGGMPLGGRAGSGSAAPGGGGGGNTNADYAFVLMDAAPERRDGFLMRSAQFNRFLKALTSLAQTPKKAQPAPSTAAHSSVASSVAAAEPKAEHSISAQVPAVAAAETGPLGAAVPARSPADDATRNVASDSLHLPPSESVGDSTFIGTLESRQVSDWDHTEVSVGGMRLPGSTTAQSLERHFSADEHTFSPTVVNASTSSPEAAGHLRLPRTDSMNSGDDGDSVKDQPPPPPPPQYVDPTVSAPSHLTDSSNSGNNVRHASSDDASGPVLFGLCAVVSKRDSTARRGGITKSVAVLGPSLVWLEPFFPVLVAAAQYCCDVSGTDNEALKELQRILKRCYDSINNAAGVVAAGRAMVDQLTAEVGKYCSFGNGQRAYVYYNDAPFGTTIRAKIPLSPESNDIAFTRYSLETVIETFGPSSMQLILGILTEKKILILSRQGEATDVCEVALSLGIIGNLLDRSFMAKKVFPYVSVSSVDHFMTVPGYVVGTLNPIFESVNPWGWDFMCDLDNKTVLTAAERLLRKSNGINSVSTAGNWATATAGLASAVGVSSGGADAEAMRNLPAPLQLLYKRLINTIYHLRALRVGATERNRRLRLLLEDFLYTTVLVGHVTGSTITVPATLYPIFAHRSMHILRLEMALTSMLDQVSSQVLNVHESPALLLNCAALRQCSSGETPVQRTLQTLLGLLTSPHAVKLFLRRMTLAVGGLNAVGMQLTHPSAETRAAAVALLTRVEATAEGKAAVASMNSFFLMIYESGGRHAGH